jgi:acetoin utilization protein AcuC
LNGYEVPIDIPNAARDVLGALTWAGSPKSRPVLPHMKTTLRDLPRNGAIRDDIRRDVATLRARDVP